MPNSRRCTVILAVAVFWQPWAADGDGDALDVDVDVDGPTPTNHQFVPTDYGLVA